MSPADFVPLREIGRGAHGVVHLARNPATGAFAALKVCPRPDGANPAARAAWERERRDAFEFVGGRESDYEPGWTPGPQTTFFEHCRQVFFEIFVARPS